MTFLTILQTILLFEAHDRQFLPALYTVVIANEVQSAYSSLPELFSRKVIEIRSWRRSSLAFLDLGISRFLELHLPVLKQTPCPLSARYHASWIHPRWTLHSHKTLIERTSPKTKTKTNERNSSRKTWYLSINLRVRCGENSGRDVPFELSNGTFGAILDWREFPKT